MMVAMQWFMFAMMIWGCCIVMSAISRRWAPELMDDGCAPAPGRRHRHHQARTEPEEAEDPRDAEIQALKERVATLEAIVTDRRFQWEQEFRR